jgi:SAM-dependent methyltransferase
MAIAERLWEGSPLPPALAEDVFGMQLRRCWNDGRGLRPVTEILELWDGTLYPADVRRYFAGHDEWSELERWAIAQARGAVLDIGTGAARHALHLRDSGRHKTVIGLDISPGAVTVARSRGLAGVVQRDMLEYASDAGRTFETLLMAGNNLGLLRNRDYARDALKQLGQLVAPGGQLIGFAGDPRVLPLRHQDANVGRGAMPGQLTGRLRLGRLAGEWFDFLYLTPAELVEIVDGSGWSVVDLRDSPTGLAAILAWS